jgi:hypothetical protein
MVEGGGGVRRSVETGSGIVLGLGTTTYVCMYWGSCWGLELGQASMKSRRIPRPLLGVCTLLKVDGLLLENTINPVKLPPTTYPPVPKLSSAPHQCRRRPAWPLCCSRISTTLARSSLRGRRVHLGMVTSSPWAC